MHVRNSESICLVNAEVDSMGGVADDRVGISSPRQVALEKAEAELRHELTLRKERRLELEFLRTGGNPLDFKCACGSSVGFRSTSLNDQQPEQLLNREAYGSVAFTASPHADSIESTGIAGTTVCEPNGADNLLLGNNELLEGDENSLKSGRRKDNANLEQPLKVYSNQNAKDSEDSAIFRPYARRNRSKPNRDGVRSSCGSMLQSRGGRIAFPAYGGSRNVEALASEKTDQKDQSKVMCSDPRRASSNGCTLPSDNQVDEVLDCERATEEALGDSKGCLPEDKLNICASHSSRNDLEDQLLEDFSKESSLNLASGDPVGGDQLVSTVHDQAPCEATRKAKEDTSYLDEFTNSKVHQKIIASEGQDSNAAFSMKGLDSESSCTETSLGLDVNNDNDETANPQIVDSSRISVEKTSDRANEMKTEKNEKGTTVEAMHDDDRSCVNQNLITEVLVKVKEDSHADNSGLRNGVQYPSSTGGLEQHETSVPETEKAGKLSGHSANESSETCNQKSPGSIVVSVTDIPEGSSSGRKSTVPADFQTSGVSDMKLIDKAGEDFILEEAQKIEAKRKKIAKLSDGTLHVDSRKKTHWEFVLEEMAWLANDFAQERLWKISAASQLCHQAAVASYCRLESQSHHRSLKKIASTIAKAVMEFWKSVEVHANGDHAGSQGTHNHNLKNLREVDTQEILGVDCQASNLMVNGKEHEQGCQGKKSPGPVQKYAVRFLEYVRAPVPAFQSDAPRIPEISCEDIPTEGSLFYTVPSSAMELYRKSIESYLVQYEKTGSCMHEEVSTSMYDAGEEFGYQENVYDEDEGETNSNYIPRIFTSVKPTKFFQKRRKNSLKSYNSRTYELGGNMPYGPCASGTQQSMLMGRRTPSSLHVGSIPTKRMRTASRQRMISPYGTGVNGVVESQGRTDASSGDTSSFQDDQSTLHGGSQIQRSVEVESARDFEKKLIYDSAETSKPKKKKKTKHPGTTFEHGWQLDSTAPSEQRDNCRKRLESHNLDSNGLYGHNHKKPKTMKQLADNNFDNIAPMPGSVASPVASQMSNMSNPKILKLFGGREKGRRAKVAKTSVLQAGSGSPWSLFEDQALVVLVHDMGPNWELISDAINSTLHLKRIYRKPQECKERHKILMDRCSGDGTESAEDSGSAHSYPSTLPGIPKGSARQLFQQLQRPMEEETIISHFGVIISIGQKLHCRKKDKPNPKHVAPVHNSHVIALSQVCPNNLNGDVLRPIDLCDADSSNAEVLPLGYQGSHGSSGLPLMNQGVAASVLPNAGLNSSLNGSSGMIVGSNQSLPSGSFNPSSRDGRYGVPRSSPLTIDEQQRMQQHNQMLPRNTHHSNLSVAGTVSGIGRAVRMIPGGNGMGMMSGMNRNNSMPRPAYQGMGSSTVLNSGSMLSSGMVGMQNSVNMHPGAGPGQGNPMIRSREHLHTLRPGHNSELQRQVMVPELRMQAAQGGSQGVTPYGGLSSAFPNQTTSPSAQAFPGHAQQQNQIPPLQSHALGNHHHPTLQRSNHTSASQQQAYAIRLGKERQLQQRYLRQQQQQQFATSNSVVPHTVTPHGQQQQLPISSFQNSSQVPPQSTSHMTSLASHTESSPMTAHPLQPQKKHLSHGLIRNPQIDASALSNQMDKPRQQQLQQQQQFAQSGRSHPQQRQQSQQQAKIMKGVGRGNLLVQQNPGIDPAHLNGLSAAMGNQSAEKGEQIMQLMQGQVYNSGVNSIQSSKPYTPPLSSNQSQMQRLYSGGTASSPKQPQHIPLASDKTAQNHTLAVPSGHAYSASHQTVPPATMSCSHQQSPLHPQLHRKHVNHTQQTVQRMLQENFQANSDSSSKFSRDHAQSTGHSLKNTVQTLPATSMPQSCTESPKITPVVSDAVSSQREASEPASDSSMSNPNPQVGSIGGPSFTKSNGGESMPSLCHGVGQRQLSGSLPLVGHNIGSQWEHQSPIQKFTTASTSQHQSPENLILHDQQQSSQQ